MEIEKELRSYRAAMLKLESLTAELESWRAFAEKVTPSLTGLPGGSHSDGTRTEVAAEKILSIVDSINAQMDEATAARSKVEELIALVPAERQQYILRLFYINGMTWREICEETGCSDSRYLRRLKAKAVWRIGIETEKNQK